MKPNQLLWQISTARRKGTDLVLDDATLIAFRDGALSQQDQAEVEEHLATSSASRARLAALAGVVADAPPAAIRERVLAGDHGAADTAGAATGRAWRWQLAAAVVGIAMLLPFLVGEQRTDSPPPWVGSSAFEVSLAALATTRGEDGANPERTAEAYPDTRLTITVEALGGARDGLEYAVFRERGDTGLTPVADGVTLTEYRGAAALSARAGTLLGETPGPYALWVVVAETGAMPGAAAPGTSAPDHLNGPRSRAYQLQVQLLSVQTP